MMKNKRGIVFTLIALIIILVLVLAVIGLATYFSGKFIDQVGKNYFLIGLIVVAVAVSGRYLFPFLTAILSTLRSIVKI